MAKTLTMPTNRARRCALGEYRRRHGCFAPLRAQVQMPQQPGRYRPVEKVLAALLGIRCGAQTRAQSNGTIRVEPAMPRAWGRTSGAEPSTSARTLRAGTATTVDRFAHVPWYDLKR
jgi:hypothetical protein